MLNCVGVNWGTWKCRAWIRRSCTGRTTRARAMSCSGWCARRRGTCCGCRAVASTLPTASSAPSKKPGTASPPPLPMSRSSSQSSSCPTPGGLSFLCLPGAVCLCLLFCHMSWPGPMPRLLYLGDETDVRDTEEAKNTLFMKKRCVVARLAWILSVSSICSRHDD